MKKCCRCKEGKQDIYFCKNKNTKDGLHVHCKECEKNRQKEWRLKNPDLWQKQKDRNLIKYREKYSIELTRPRKINKKGEGHTSSYGYHHYRGKEWEGHPCADKYGRVLAHRLVLFESMGRKLNKYEHVHHKNGIRNDNRLENLEIWHKGHPPGQRIEDKIKWCKEFLEEYDYKVTKE